MKKTYMIPTMKVVNVKVQNILAGSLDASVQDGGTLNSRRARFSDWDEEEEQGPPPSPLQLEGEVTKLTQIEQSV